MLDRQFWVGTEKHSLERGEGPVGSEGEVRKNANSRNSLLTTAASTQISNNIKQQQKTDISKQNSKNKLLCVPGGGE